MARTEVTDQGAGDADGSAGRENRYGSRPVHRSGHDVRGPAFGPVRRARWPGTGRKSGLRWSTGSADAKLKA